MRRWGAQLESSKSVMVYAEQSTWVLVAVMVEEGVVDAVGVSDAVLVNVGVWVIVGVRVQVGAAVIPPATLTTREVRKRSTMPSRQASRGKSGQILLINGNII